MILTVIAVISLNSVNQLIFVMVKYGVLFEVQTEFLNNIQTIFSFKGLNIKIKKKKNTGNKILCAVKIKIHFICLCNIFSCNA
jgi:hypothetical protein